MVMMEVSVLDNEGQNRFVERTGWINPKCVEAVLSDRTIAGRTTVLLSSGEGLIITQPAAEFVERLHSAKASYG